MYIQPNTTIKLYHKVPLDVRYQNTLYFANKTAQNNYFHGTSSILKSTFDSQSYQRVNRGRLKLAIKADYIYDINYMAFKNTTFEDKWFYAFVTKVEYVNNDTCMIDYVLDVMQTYLFDVELKQCYVEREHVQHDNKLQYKLDEGLGGGDYVIKSITDIPDLQRMCTLVIWNTDTAPRELTDGVFQGIGFSAYLTDTFGGMQALRNFISPAQGHTDDIYYMGAIPYFLIKDWVATQEVGWVGGTLNGFTTSADLNYTADIEFTDLDGYVPDNNKMFNYPYCKIHITNNLGNSADFKPEYFNSSHRGEFVIKGITSSNSSVVIMPTNYRVSGTLTDYESGIVLNNFPDCSWVSDTFYNYIINNKNSIAVSMLGTEINMAISAALMIGSMGMSEMAMPTLSQIGSTSTALSTVTNGYGSTGGGINYPSSVNQTGLMAGGYGLVNSAMSGARLYANIQDLKVQPDQACGSTNNSNINIKNGKNTFSIIKMTINSENAKVIDTFFTKYGYKINQLKVPQVTSRPHWNYIKTNGCVAIGSCPADDLESIKAIYDNGITFWKHADEVGNYSLINRPV